MNYHLTNIPERELKPRDNGITMVMDKGLSIRQCEDLIESSGKYIDFVKLGWSTSYLTENLKEKIKIFRDANIAVYFGGTLFEAFLIRDQLDDYVKVLKKYNLTINCLEVVNYKSVYKLGLIYSCSCEKCLFGE